MKKYWVMKTFQEWWVNFQTHLIIGVDEEGLDTDYNSLPQEEIIRLLNANDNNFKDYQNRIFQQFCKWMQIDDFVIIGIGQTTTFNIAGIVRISGVYQFEQNQVPRHIRPVEILKTFPQPIPLLRFLRTPRLERIDEADFHESIISLL